MRFANNEKSLLAIVSTDGSISVCHVECASIVPACESPTEPPPASAAAGPLPLREVRSASPTAPLALDAVAYADAEAATGNAGNGALGGDRDHSAPPTVPHSIAVTPAETETGTGGGGGGRGASALSVQFEAEAEAEAEGGAEAGVEKLEQNSLSLGSSVELEALSPSSASAPSDSHSSPALSPAAAAAAAARGVGVGAADAGAGDASQRAPPAARPHFDSISQTSFLFPNNEPSLGASSRQQSNSYVLLALKGHTGPINGIQLLYMYSVSAQTV